MKEHLTHNSHKSYEDEEAAVRLINPSSPKASTSIKPSQEDKEPCHVQIVWLLIWMANNILVTMLNKASFAKVDFKYPFTLSTIHMACNIVGAQIFFAFSRTIKPKQIESNNRRHVLIFSIIFSLNIAIGNTSLSHVSVNFNQICRSLVPVIVLGISIFYYGKAVAPMRKYAVIPIVFGVILTFYGDVSFTTLGASYTILCVLLAALKSVVAGELLTGDLKLHEIDLLSKMAPLALIQIGSVAFMTGEVSEIIGRWDELSQTAAPQVVLLSGFLSFTLNVSSFIANKVTSALTLSIAANVKQVLIVTFATAYFGDTVGVLNGIGIGTVIVGSFGYGYISMQNKA